MDSFLIWLLALAALALAFGPILYFLPSKKDRRLAALRTEARRLGLQVELRPVPKLDAGANERVTAGGRQRSPTHPSVCYWLALPLATAPLDPWRLLRGPSGWVADAELPPPEDLAARLLPLFDPLPEDAVAVEHRNRSLGCCWLERFPAGTETVASLKAALMDIAKALAAWGEQAFQGERAGERIG